MTQKLAPQNFTHIKYKCGLNWEFRDTLRFQEGQKCEKISQLLLTIQSSNNSKENWEILSNFEFIISFDCIT